MRLLSLLWRHRLVLLLSLVVSAVVATPFALRAQPTYMSTAEMFLPSADPVAEIVSDTSALSLQLQGFAAGDLSAEVRTAARADAPKIVAVDAELQKSSSDVYLLTSQARTPAAATTAVQFAAAAMKDEAGDLLQEQFARFRESNQADISEVFREKRNLAGLIVEQQVVVAGLVSQLEGVDETSDEANVLEDRLEEQRGILNSRQQERRILAAREKGLVQLPAIIGEKLSVAQSVARVVSGPSLPRADTQIRVAQLVGGAVIAGLLVAVMLTLWLERDALRGDPSAGSPPPRLAEVIRNDQGPGSASGRPARTQGRDH